jgi:hypothetical protein
MPAFNELEVCYFNLKPQQHQTTHLLALTPMLFLQEHLTIQVEILPKHQQQLFKQAGQNRFCEIYYWSSTEVSATIPLTFRVQ